MEIYNIRPQVMSEAAQPVIVPEQFIAPLGQNNATTVRSQLDLLQQENTSKGGIINQIQGMADAAIQAVLAFIRSATVIFAPPPPPPQITAPVVASTKLPKTDTAIVVASQNPFASVEPLRPSTTSPSLIPPWAQIFKMTGESEFRPGGASNNAYIDLRDALKGKINTLEILSDDGMNVLATGKYEGLTKEGKPRYRFNLKGVDLPKGAIIKATLVDTSEGSAGGVRYIEMPKPHQKFVW